MFVRALATTLGAATLLSAAPASAQTVSAVFKRVRGSVAVIYTAGRTLADRSSGELVSIGGLGSGVLISDDEVLTAAHVVQTADQVMVEFPTGERIMAQVVTSEPAADLALLKLDSRPTGVVPAPMGDSDLSEVGDEVFVVGAPLGASHTLTVGHLSARRQPTRSVGNFFAAEMLQTDAAINQGNSGGPMFNMNGEVIGVVSYILSQTGGFVGLGFAVSSNTVEDVLLSGVQIWSGIDMLTLDEDMSRMLNVPGGGGALVQQVAAESLGEKLGLKGGTVAATIGDTEVVLGGDIIIAVLGIPVSGMDNYEQMRAALETLKAGDIISVRVLRGGETRDLGTPFQPRSPFRE
jgi:S1-C subfamily serine protease